MAVKTLDNHIKQAFLDLGFSEEEIKNGCWLLTRENKATGEEIKVAWIALHKFLERAAIMAGITFDKPEVLNLQPTEIALLVSGKKGELSAWAIGEASDANLTKMSKAYRWAMTEKRAKDRVILKLLGISGDMYSEEEADEFKEKKQEKSDFEKYAAQEKRATTNATKKGEEKPQPKGTLDERFQRALAFLKNETPESFRAKPSHVDSINTLLKDLHDAGCAGYESQLMTEYNRVWNFNDNIPDFSGEIKQDYRV